MKHLYIFFLLNVFILVHSREVNGQYVTLSDTIFRNFLINKYPSCFNSGQLDTTCSLISNATTLSLTNTGISDLTGIKYFKNLDTLSCSVNNISSLPSLPLSLIYLDCSFNNISSLPSLPTSLSYLQCSGNQLSSLPTLPSSLTFIMCDDNNLTSLPSLPNSLTNLSCSVNKLESLPVLPSTVKFLECGRNNIANLPLLPDSLGFLDCAYNNLYCLPSIPNTIYNLSTKGNHISCIYDISLYVAPFADTIYPICNSNDINHCPYDTNHISLPDPQLTEYIQLSFPSCINLAGMVDTTCSLIVNVTSIDVSNFGISNLSGIQYFKNLDTLNCSENNLTSLPPLPLSLSYLDCSGNKLTSLPQLTDSVPNGRVLSSNSLLSLNCQNNQLHCLPLLPDGIQTLEATGNPISCVLNLPSSLTTVDSTYSICNSTNDTYGCIQQVTGTTNAIATSASVNVFPNPSTGMVTINCPFNATGIKIYRIEGKSVYETNYNNTSYAIDLSVQSKGVYVVQILSNSGLVTQKLVLE